MDGEEAEQSTQFGDSIRPGRGREREKDGQLVNTAACGDLGCNWPLTSLFLMLLPLLLIKIHYAYCDVVLTMGGRECTIPYKLYTSLL